MRQTSNSTFSTLTGWIAMAAALLLLISACSQPQTQVQISAEPLPEAEQPKESVPVVLDSSGQNLKLIRPQDELLIYVRSDGAPGMYLDTDGTLKGFYVDLDRLLMQVMGQKYRFVPYDNVGPVVQLMKTGEAHSALAVPDLPDYRALLNLSKPFETLSFVAFVNETNSDIKGTNRSELIASLEGKRVGVQTRGHIFQALRDYRDITLIEYPTTTVAMGDLHLGKLDAVPEVLENGLYYKKVNGWKVKPVGSAIIQQLDTTGFSKALDTSIVDRYNAALDTITKDGRFKRLYDAYLASLNS